MEIFLIFDHFHFHFQPLEMEMVPEIKSFFFDPHPYPPFLHTPTPKTYGIDVSRGELFSFDVKKQKQNLKHIQTETFSVKSMVKVPLKSVRTRGVGRWGGLGRGRGM